MRMGCRKGAAMIMRTHTQKVEALNLNSIELMRRNAALGCELLLCENSLVSLFLRASKNTCMCV